MSTVAVYRNRSSRCCILLTDDNKHVTYISTEEGNGELKTDVRKMPACDFHDEYAELATYPVLRAVEHYLNPLTAAIEMSDRAAKHLHRLRTDKAIAMEDQDRLTLAERNVLATHKASIPKTGPCPAVAPCLTTEVIPGSSAKPKKGTWDHKETPSESNEDAARRVVAKYKATKPTRATKRNPSMTEQTDMEVTQESAESKKPAAKKAVKKAAPKAPSKPAAKKADTTSKTNSTKKDSAMSTKTEAAKKTVKKTADKATKAPAKAAKVEKATKPTKATKPAKAEKATKLAKGSGKAAAAKAPAKGAGKAAAKPQDGARRGRKGAFDEGQKIKVLVKDNPKRQGTASYETFELLKKSKTVGEFFAAGGGSHNLHWNIERGYIEVV